MAETLLTDEAYRNDIARALGRKGLERNVGTDSEPVALPQGYHYSDPSFLSPAKIHALFKSVEIGADLSDDFLAERSAMAAAEGLTPIDVAVENDEGELVGFGSIFYRGSEGEFSDFIVHPKHQSQGIGRAIILERMRLAEQAGITTLRLPYLEYTNALHHSQGRPSFYAELGFQLDEHNYGLVWHAEQELATPHDFGGVEFQV